MIGRTLDNLIGIFSPTWAAQRINARATLSQIQNAAQGGNAIGYAAGKPTRLNRSQLTAMANENAMPRENIARMRAASYQLYRDCPQARKICRTLESKVIGRGLRPQSQVTRKDGTPHLEFRAAAHALWSAMQKRLDYRGRPGQGGQDFTGLSKTALRGCILGGEVLPRYRPGEIKAGQKLPELTVQLVHADRLSDTPSKDIPKGHTFFHGIELNKDDQRVAYHVLKYHPSDPRGAAAQEIVRIPASEMGHLYAAEDIDQLRGVPWMSAAILKMQGTTDYEFTEMTAAKIAACVVFGYRRSSGQNSFGVTLPDGDELTDGDGNKLTGVQPGMIIDEGRNGQLNMYNPARPTANASEFIAHMLRSQAVSVPGVKGSTLTGDYRNSSFSSERSADNDAWPEIEGLQDWFAASWCQPTYEQVITAGMLSGWFKDVVDIGDFQANRDDYLRCNWQGPVARSINPTDDAEASRKRVQNGQSTPQIEAALAGKNWQENVMQLAEFIQFCEDNELPESIIAQALGIDQQDNPMGTDPSLEEEAANAATSSE